MSNRELASEIELTLNQLRDCWNSLALDSIRELWVKENPEPLYLPEEAGDFLTSWAAIESYWQTTKNTVSKMRMRVWDLNARYLEPDLASAWYRMHWNATVAGYEEPVGGENRVSALLRRTPVGWRFCQYVEAPLAPMIYLRRLYALDVDADFDDEGATG